MKTKAALAARLILGLIFFVFGINGMVMIFTGGGFIPMPPMPEAAGAFMGALAASKFSLIVLKVTEVSMGALLLMGLYVPLALVVLTVVIYHILLFHIFLAPGGLAMAIFLVAAHGYLTHCYWPYFKEVLTCKAVVK